MLIDQGLDEIDDPLLARSGRVELSAHFHEAAVNVIAKTAEVLSQAAEVLSQVAEVLLEIAEIRPHGVETRGRRPAEVTDLGPDLPDVTVCRAGEYPSRRGVLLDGSKPPADVVEIILVHGREFTAATSTGAPPATASVDNGRQCREIS